MNAKKYINIIALALIILLIIMNFYQIKAQSNIEKTLNQISVQENQVQVSDVETNTKLSKNNEIEAKEEIKPGEKIGSPQNWQLLIPSIDLIAPIEQGTTEEILERSIGHFDGSGFIDGNIALAAHNRGYSVNYFEKLKNLLLNDIIIYRYGDTEISYCVYNVVIIKETDWSYVQNTEDNILTLITCIEDEPEYRLCVQARPIAYN